MTKPSPSKEAKYKDNIQRSLREMYLQMEKVGQCIPEDIDEDDLTHEMKEAVNIITAIEEEWIVDPLKRAELSMLKWDEEELD
jgi:DNA-binding transcriptional regulator GbsR (MarR family)